MLDNASSQGWYQLEVCQVTASTNKGGMGLYNQDKVFVVCRDHRGNTATVARHQLVSLRDAKVRQTPIASPDAVTPEHC